MPAHMNCASYIVDPGPDFPLLIPVKRYWDPTTASSDSGALTLAFSHGTGFPSELWEPCIDELFSQLKDNRIKVQDVWTIESPNHGRGAVINEEVLNNHGYNVLFRWEDYAKAVHLVLSGLGKGIDVDLSTRRFVGIGHSMGAVAFMLSTTMYPKIPYSALVLVEAMLFPLGPTSGKMRDFLVEGAIKRRDKWSSLEEARKMLLSKKQWKSWDPESFELYLKYGMRSTDPSKPDGEVTLATPKINEGSSYNDPNGSPRGYHFLSTVVTRLPVHMIYGEEADYIPLSLREDTLANASGGIDKFASVSVIGGGGHLIVQSQPRPLGRAVYDALVLNFSPSPSKCPRPRL